jgi:hypothetical protein
VGYFVSCVSKDHVVAGSAGGYVQSTDAAQLQRLQRGDLVLFYSEGTRFRAGARLQAFTAVGRVAGGAPHQVTVTPVFKPWRRRMEFIEADETSIVPLAEALSFVTDKTSLAMPAKRGLFEIGIDDFMIVADAMKADL